MALFLAFLFKGIQVLNEQWCAEVEKLEAFNLENGSMKHFGILKQNILFQNKVKKKCLGCGCPSLERGFGFGFLLT